MWCFAISAALTSVAMMEQPDLIWMVMADGLAVVKAKTSDARSVKVVREAIDRPGEPVFLGYPHGPKMAEYVPKDRRALGEFCLIESDGAKTISFDFQTSDDAFACDTGESAVMRASLSDAPNPLDRAVYDRASDRLLRIGQADSIQIERVASGWRISATGAKVRATVLHHYYRDHLGYFQYSPKSRLWPKPVAGWCSWAAYGQGITEDQMVHAARFFGANLRDYGYSVIQMDDGFQRVPQMGDQGPRTDERIADLWSKAIPEKFPHGLGVKSAYLDSIKDLKKLGWDYFKLDTLRHILYDNYRICPDHFGSRGRDANEVFRQLIGDFKKAVGANTYFLACWGTIPELAGIPDGCRIGEDVGPNWRSIELVGRYVSQFQYLNNVVWRNDPDYMCFRASLDHCRFWASLLSLAGVQLMVSDPIETYDAERLDILRRVGPPMVSRPKVLSPQKEGKELWSLQVLKGGESWDVVGRFAWKALPTSKVSLAKLGLSPVETYLAFDFWNSKFLGEARGVLKFPALEQGQCTVVGFRKRTGFPQVLGTDRHLAQGYVELEQVGWRDGKLSGAMRLEPGKEWSLYVYVPEGYTLSRKLGPGWWAAQNGKVVRVQFKEGKGLKRFSIPVTSVN
ncbi:MAG: hypothetical protein HZC36_12780 [Armatimonadetes bacterium]|nr:hypothetical protein [Armatimonadota bacterium]